MEISESEMDSDVKTVCSSKKKKVHGRMTDVSKKLNVQSHSLGPPCNCERFKCFEIIPEAARNQIIQKFNLLSSVAEQNSYLCGLISVQEIQSRRPRLEEDIAKLHDASYSYRVRFINLENYVEEVHICFKAFLSLHGIGKKKVEILQKSLKITGVAPTDGRGKHLNRPRSLSDTTKQEIMEHISSFKGRKGHYNLKDSSKTYLPDDLNIKKMFNMYCDLYKDSPVSYETYRSIFSRQFNISFGYPRVDTCSSYDKFIVQVTSLTKEKDDLVESDGLQRFQEIDKEIRRLETENKIHKMKAEEFYKRKRNAKNRSKNDESFEAVCFDFQKNLPVPNISTNDVYYRRQLSIYTFNVHILSNSKSVFYTYPETVGAKGSNNVCSMLHSFVYNYLDMKVKKLEMFCDSCGGQNNNYTVLRFLHNLVHVEKRFEEVKVCFPIRRHSYLETDKNMGLINQKSKVELPSEWAEVFRQARNKPCPFDVVEVDQDVFREWTNHLKNRYRKTCPFKTTQPIRELKIVRSHPSLIYHRSAYHAAFDQGYVTNRKLLRQRYLAANEFQLPDYLYKDLLPMKLAKYNDLMHLAQFCSRQAQEYYKQLPKQ